VLDLRTVETAKLRRAANTARRGIILHSGYQSALIRCIAHEKNFSPPIICTMSRDWPAHFEWLPRNIPEDAFTQLLQLSNVRHEIWMSQNSESRQVTPRSYFMRGFNCNTLVLYGWSGDRPLVHKAVMDIVNAACPAYLDSMNKLADYIESRPCIEREVSK
jgi:hypothetical protein